MAAGHLGNWGKLSSQERWWSVRLSAGCVRFGAAIKVTKLIVVSHLHAQKKSPGLREAFPSFPFLRSVSP